MIAVGSVVALLVAIAVAALGSVEATQPVPSGGSALDQLQRYTERGFRSHLEVDASTLTSQHTHIVSGASGTYLLEAATGTNLEGQARAVFIVYEVDPLTVAWRPLFSVDGYLEEDGITASDFEPPFDLPGLDNGTHVIGYLGATGGTPRYLSSDGEWKQLTLLSSGVLGAGFALRPSDAPLPLSLKDAG